MLRSILLALDDTPGAIAARTLAIALAARTGAALTGAAVLDRPHTRDAAEPVPPGGLAFAEHRNAVLAARLEEEAQQALAAARQSAGPVAITPLLLDDAPEPALLRAGATHDLIVMGRDATLGLEQAEDGLAPCAEALLRDGARPLLLVPPDAAAGTDGPVLVAYDGSLPAMRALQLFALLGLAEGSPVKLASVDENEAEAVRLAAEGAAYLAHHGIAAKPWPVTGGDATELLIAEADASRARLMVMGAFGTRGLRALLLGSPTRTLLRHAPCAVFVHH